MNYSIRDLEHLTGIKAHTIRIWEKRYKLLNPERKPTKIRLYNDNDLKKIINVAMLNQAGIKISKIARSSDRQIAEMVEALKITHAGHQVRINKLINAMIDLNEEDFLKILNDSTIQHGFETTVVEVIFPFLEKVGILWQTAHILPVHEHFISNLIRQKLIVAIDSVVVNKQNLKGTAMMFLPEGEYHEFGLLFYYYILKRHNYLVFYLGQSTPYSDLLSVSERIKPDIIITSMVSSFTGIDPEILIKKLAGDFNKVRIAISGNLITSVKGEIPENISLIKSLSDFYSFIS